MTKIFIIGNGFDLSHGLETRYDNFYDYLIKNYPDASMGDFILPQSYITPKGEEVTDINDTVSFILRIISITSGGKWKELEYTLGHLDFSECFDDMYYKRDKDGDIDLWKQVYTNEDIGSDIELSMGKITELFSNWINSIDIVKENIHPKNSFLKLVDINEDLFLTFNYTDTLEKIYNAKNIFHIHGKQGGNLVFGHGNKIKDGEEFMEKYIGAEGILYKLQENLRKDTSAAIEDNIEFFNRISPDIREIYSYGFSFSEVDMVYISKICNRLESSDVTWYLNEHSSLEKIEKYKEKINNAGFKGKFKTYKIGK